MCTIFDGRLTKLIRTIKKHLHFYRAMLAQSAVMRQ